MSHSTSIFSRCRSTAANSGMSATPELFRPDQSPLGAIHLPQALIPWATLRHRSAVDSSVAGWPSSAVPTWAVTLRPRGLHCIRDEPMHCLLSLSPNHRGGGLRYVRNPCSFRWSRTPWPPTSCARLPRPRFQVAEPLQGAIPSPGLRL